MGYTNILYVCLCIYFLLDLRRFIDLERDFLCLADLFIFSDFLPPFVDVKFDKDLNAYSYADLNADAVCTTGDVAFTNTSCI